MEKNNVKNEEPIINEVIVAEEVNVENKTKNNQMPIVSAIIVAGVLIAGAILLKGSNLPTQGKVPTDNGIGATATTLAPVNALDKVIGNSNAKVTLVLYEDFQCPWCGKFVSESEQVIRDTYVKNGQAEIVFRDFPFLGSFAKPYVVANDESINAAEAARCAGDQ